jgi:hypothetical protein
MVLEAFTRRITTYPRRRLAKSLVQLREALDLPSRKELAELTARLEALDARIASLAAQRVEEISRTVPTLPEAQAQAQAQAPSHAASADAEADSNGKKKPLKNRR